MTVDGKLFGLPTHGHFGTNVLYYNKNLTRAAGVNVPDDGAWSIDDFVVAAQKLVKRDQDQWGYNSPWGFPEFGVFYLRQYGGEWLDEAGKRSLLNSAEARAGLEWIYNTQAKFQTINSHYRADAKGFDTLFVEGKLGFVNWTPGYTAQWKAPGPGPDHAGQREVRAGGRPLPAGAQRAPGDAGLRLRDGPHQPDQAGRRLAVAQVRHRPPQRGGAGLRRGRLPRGAHGRLAGPQAALLRPHLHHHLQGLPPGAGALRLPANNRYVDLLKATTDELTPLYRGQTGVQDAAGKAVAACNAILGQ